MSLRSLQPVRTWRRTRTQTRSQGKLCTHKLHGGSKSTNVFIPDPVHWITETIPLLIEKHRSHKSQQAPNEPTLKQRSQSLSKTDMQTVVPFGNETACTDTVVNDETKTSYVKGKQIGKGAFKVVFDACVDHPRTSTSKHKSCVHPVVIVEQEVKTEDDLNAIRRELFFGAKLSAEGLAPRIFHSQQCENQFTMLVERMHENIYEMAKHQTRSFFNKSYNTKTFPVLMFYSDQFMAIIQLIINISRHSVVHGDLKIENIMTDDKRKIFKVIDFGFTGDYGEYTPIWGFTHVYGCPGKETIPAKIGVTANFWQFFQCLIGEVFVFIWNKDTQKLFLFHDLAFPQDQDLLAAQERATIQNACTEKRTAKELLLELKQEKDMRDELLTVSERDGHQLETFKFSVQI